MTLSRILPVVLLLAVFCGSSHATEVVDPPPNLFDAERQTQEPQKPITNVDRAFGAFQRGMYLTAFELALPEAQKGDANAQTMIAEMYDRGLGIGRDSQKAADWYKIAAKSGNREARFAYGVKLLEGKYVPKDIELGLEMMKLASDAGHPTAMFNYATHLINERPTTATYRKVLPLYEKAAEYRLADAYYSLAKIYEEGLATGINDPEKGLYWLEKAASAGVDTAQVELAIKLLNDNSKEENVERAFGLFRIAANRGNVIAQNRLSHMLFEGLGTERLEVEAAKWHILASRSGRYDFDLDRYMEALPDDVRQQALQLANRWPAVN